MNENFLLLKYRARSISECWFSPLISTGDFINLTGIDQRGWFDPFCELSLRVRPFGFRTTFEVNNGHLHVLTVTCGTVIDSFRDDDGRKNRHRINSVTKALMQYERNKLYPLPYYIEFE